MRMTWKLMKEIVKELRIKQKRLMKKQGGLNEVMVVMSIIRRSDMVRLYFYPHGINLTTGFVVAFEDNNSVSRVWQKINIRRMLQE